MNRFTKYEGRNLIFKSRIYCYADRKCFLGQELLVCAKIEHSFAILLMKISNEKLVNNGRIPVP